ncbi:MAG: aminotransferase class I/II-fold pyridoxal phosphate-dependent enzyme [Gemmatimonadales bacterium]|nr:aminotransferase class I/II-fold pyridoxal phosphate-dependent enzyme [Gemmatimonadales bacterium]
MRRFDPEQAMVETRRVFGEHGGVVPSIERSSTFSVLEPGTMPEIFAGEKNPEMGGCFLYSRHFNPTVNVLSRYLSAMEGTEAGICTATGMGAITVTILQICKLGSHLVSSNTIYGGTHAFIKEVLPEMGIESTFVDPTDLGAVEAAIRPETKMIYVETMGNPKLNIADLPALSKLAREHDVKLVVDNTFTPVMISAKELGADVVLYSLTKFINGASDLMGGAVLADKNFIFELMDLHKGRAMLLGPAMDSRVAFDIAQRLPLLPLRMREHSRRTLAIAEAMAEMGVAISYPGLKSHPQHELISSLVNESYGYGGLLTVDCQTLKKAEHLMSVLQNQEKFGIIAVSLGYYDTLLSCPGSSTSSEISEDEQRKMGLSPGLVRVSIGLSGSLSVRIEQMKRALIEVGLAE